MIALDTNVLVRFLVADHIGQAQSARTLLGTLTSEHPGFVCREVCLELSWVLKRAYGFSRGQVADVFAELVASEELYVETADDVVRAAEGYRRGGAEFSDQMIAAAARRSGSDGFYTFDRQAAQLDGAVLMTEE